MQNIYIIGDSTASIKLSSKRPESGWGEYLSSYLSDSYIVKNHAKNGESTKSFKDQGLFEAVINEIKPNDLLIIQFGHNDSKITDPNKYTLPFKSYQDYLSYYIDSAQAKDAKVAILSSIARRYFINKNSLDKKCLGDYPLAAKLLAKRKHVTFIDMFKRTKLLYEYLGDDLSSRMLLHLSKAQHPNYPDGIQDNTHLNEVGAPIIASIVYQELLNKKIITGNLVPVPYKRFIDIKRFLNKL